MIPDPIALICPYTLIEEEALAWSILLCNQAILLHPFSLPLPPTYFPLLKRGLLQIRSPLRTQEEIRLKDRNLRAIQAFIAGNPDQGFLKTLNELALGEDLETQEELVGLLKGGPFKKTTEDFSALDGQTLLCLIHEWMMQEWDLEASLAKIEEQEKDLARGWQENPEETVIWQSPGSPVLQRNETEIPCPLALNAWQELKNRLVPDPVILFTTQRWIWTDHYHLDPEEEQSLSIPLPDLGPLSAHHFQKLMAALPSKTGSTPLKDLEGHLSFLMGSRQGKSIVDFQKTLAGLRLPPKGRYDLILPPIDPLLKGPMSQRGPSGSGPLVLLSPKATLFT